MGKLINGLPFHRMMALMRYLDIVTLGRNRVTLVLHMVALLIT
jgi:hypothetical protein